MRKLKIKRCSSLVGKFGKIKIYINDAESSEIKINNVPCRLLGALKNGEEQTFQVPTKDIRIFAIGGKLTKAVSNDFIDIPAGEDDCSITGIVCFNGSGIPLFRFDGTASSESAANRIRNVKKGWAMHISLFLVGFILAFSLVLGIAHINKTKSNATFTKNGMSITLGTEFTEENNPLYTACYTSEDVLVVAIRESFSVLSDAGYDPQAMSLNDYANFVILNNSIHSAQSKTEQNLTVFEWSANNSLQNTPLRYMGVVYKTDNSFWIVQFGTQESDYYAYRSQFLKWAASVKFSHINA